MTRCFQASLTLISVEARKRVPTSAPWAPRASAAATPRPSAIPPAATTGTAPARSTSSGTSTIVPSQPPWPPASPPWATSTSAPAASAVSGLLAVDDLLDPQAAGRVRAFDQLGDDADVERDRRRGEAQGRGE